VCREKPAAENADGEDEWEEKFVLLEERAADVEVDAFCEVIVELFNTLAQALWLAAIFDRLQHYQPARRYLN